MNITVGGVTSGPMTCTVDSRSSVVGGTSEVLDTSLSGLVIQVVIDSLVLPVVSVPSDVIGTSSVTNVVCCVGTAVSECVTYTVVSEEISVSVVLAVGSRVEECKVDDSGIHGTELPNSSLVVGWAIDVDA